MMKPEKDVFIMLRPGKIYLFTPDDKTEREIKAAIEPLLGLLRRVALILSKVCK